MEEYRLYYLGRAYELSNDHAAARRALVALWQRNARAVIGDDAGQRLAALVAETGDFAGAARIDDALAARTDVPTTGAAARWGAIESHFVGGDVASILDAARTIAIKSPRAPQVADALAVHDHVVLDSLDRFDQIGRFDSEQSTARGAGGLNGATGVHEEDHVARVSGRGVDFGAG